MALWTRQFIIYLKAQMSQIFLGGIFIIFIILQKILNVEFYHVQ